jgi:hypothetical protein
MERGAGGVEDPPGLVWPDRPAVKIFSKPPFNPCHILLGIGVEKKFRPLRSIEANKYCWSVHVWSSGQAVPGQQPMQNISPGLPRHEHDSSPMFFNLSLPSPFSGWGVKLFGP